MFPNAATLWIVKICAVGVLALGLYFWGRGNGVEAERTRNATALVVCQADRAALATTLDEVNARAFAAKAGEREQAQRAEAAEKGAQADAETYEGRIKQIATQLKQAQAVKACRAQLEVPLCADLQ